MLTDNVKNAKRQDQADNVKNAKRQDQKMRNLLVTLANNFSGSILAFSTPITNANQTKLYMKLELTPEDENILLHLHKSFPAVFQFVDYVRTYFDEHDPTNDNKLYRQALAKFVFELGVSNSVDCWFPVALVDKDANGNLVDPIADTISYLDVMFNHAKANRMENAYVTISSTVANFAVVSRFIANLSMWRPQLISLLGPCDNGSSKSHTVHYSIIGLLNFLVTQANTLVSAWKAVPHDIPLGKERDKNARLHDPSTGICYSNQQGMSFNMHVCTNKSQVLSKTVRFQLKSKCRSSRPKLR